MISAKGENVLQHLCEGGNVLQHLCEGRNVMCWSTT